MTLWVITLAAAVLTALRPRRVEVRGASMEPTLAPGDRLLVLAGVAPRTGAVVALHDPRRPEGELLVKRVAALGPAGLDVRGDNPARSTDSRTFGPVPAALIEGTVVWRYGPPERAGRIARGPSRRQQ
ncbi:nickel-type superoxide dismutase maturation protease [Acidiferrimicrobium sp. IK]|uniref:nickel-type superoxide dismutase maturation protease n=1 Tax=Acidiferrimicrobium sp. IK TaxID=2871700 RepID=UPI0021CB5F0C|nr:nickel-type superoxide dismutase maturation protease [Acidiferrimicrobium sp. IK]MCU4187060.1 nickel-type superoxide dismutase maturation protease [Acidiferrimicrobium sp. IK]